MLLEHGPDIVKLILLSCKKNSSLFDASFHMSVNQNDNHHGGPIHVEFLWRQLRNKTKHKTNVHGVVCEINDMSNYA